MIKRTKGYLLLTMLVLTGLAGKLHTETLNGKDRRLLIQELKQTRNEFRDQVQDLSEKQLNFKPEKGQRSIRECILHLFSRDQELSGLMKRSLKAPNVPSKNKCSDAAIMQMARSRYAGVHQMNDQGSAEEAGDFFVENRNEQLRFVRTTTANIRAHQVATDYGVLDIYQILMLDCAYSRLYLEEISRIRSDARFPK